MTRATENNTTPSWRSYLFEALAIAFILIASGTAGYLLGGLQ
jgi:hypothetical protein